MENTILEKAVEPKNTVQFLPKDLFKVISKSTMHFTVGIMPAFQAILAGLRFNQLR
jgi:hypothetical protein